ncbi:uncharacterized protein LOC127863292 [Dreissena polymorpha]|uniref:uncharacterized protein LOC127863292 n=1 Tax=Dreissena polymorpha TaxID=45954 RepID=UPI0022647FAC|nr:uncharacterized protein LOC127863292 [Dreissena polymorpha]
MAENGQEPTIKDVMNFMRTMDNRLAAIDVKLNAIDSLEKKVCVFEKELKKIWVALEERVKRTDARVLALEEKVELVDVGATIVADRLVQLEKERNELRDDVYLKSQSMRNNLVFMNIPEDNSTGNEPPEVTERKLRDHIEETLKVAKETADTIRFERVHRAPGYPVHGKVRNIVAQFTFFRDRELVRKQWKHLTGTNFQMHEQFPPEVVEKRCKLVFHMKDARKEGKRAWIAYDT